mmetsp:Transcript_29748/g.27237  ORF Transcript_29748/g.27237 Transcript_29748/m.27237 type:complete len:108 (-) Transcript_29748:414-737(-)
MIVDDNQDQEQDSTKIMEEFKSVTKSSFEPKALEESAKATSPEKKLIHAQEFEKDNDQNFHIDFIHAMANCRALNYKLEPMDWLNVKIKAGKIVPALATTTASIAGL